ncbi:hypothetical protein UABAM_01130 [Candidatus Uabimicrobium amorphum]|uniref:Uncharacterized protein n=1 Tax=Uabimicrobium amorphum TaxID=2596890 RepID=A0A5S9IJP5_UABAM|nr:hypothetical protein UABAM_01130 [Candidatus Uabimicrobium amorphum]
MYLKDKIAKYSAHYSADIKGDLYTMTADHLHRGVENNTEINIQSYAI